MITRLLTAASLSAAMILGSVSGVSAQGSMVGKSEPRIAEPAAKPVEMARRPAAAPLTVPPKPKPRQNLAKPAPSAVRPAAVEIKPAGGGTVVASRTPVDPASETGELTPDSSAVEVIGRMGRVTMAVFSDQSKTPAERRKFFQSLLADHVDIPMLARFLAGRHWRRASTEQRAAYVSAFTDFILEVFARQLDGARLERFEVLGSKPVGRRDVMVMSRLYPGGQPLKVEWRMRRRDNRFLVIDVTTEGVSMAMTRRQEFDAIIRASGGRLDGLTAKLQEFVSKAS